jgi:hypothetical protein
MFSNFRNWHKAVTEPDYLKCDRSRENPTAGFDPKPSFGDFASGVRFLAKANFEFGDRHG